MDLRVVSSGLEFPIALKKQFREIRAHPNRMLQHGSSKLTRLRMQGIEKQEPVWLQQSFQHAMERLTHRSSRPVCAFHQRENVIGVVKTCERGAQLFDRPPCYLNRTNRSVVLRPPVHPELDWPLRLIKSP